MAQEVTVGELEALLAQIKNKNARIDLKIGSQHEEGENDICLPFTLIAADHSDDNEKPYVELLAATD